MGRQGGPKGGTTLKRGPKQKKEEANCAPPLDFAAAFLLLEQTDAEPGELTACLSALCAAAKTRAARERIDGACSDRAALYRCLSADEPKLRKNAARLLGALGRGRDAAALALKSGNTCILRSGKEAHRTACAIVAALKRGVVAAGGDPDILNIVEDTTHQSAADIMTAKGVVDLLIPRGGAELIRACVAGATVPCIETGTGICHVYVDADADLDKALDIVENAKASRPSVCNAEEVLLVHSAVAAAFLPRLQRRLVTDRAAADKTPVELRLDRRAAAIIPGKPAGENDFDTEFLDYILAIRVVDSVDEAVAHIAAHSTGHSDAIITENAAAAEIFVAGVDSAAVYVNASTRFTDGGEFGLGCEMGISTQKLHARGPMGLDELSTYKYVVRGSGQIR